MVDNTAQYPNPAEGLHSHCIRWLTSQIRDMDGSASDMIRAEGRSDEQSIPYIHGPSTSNLVQPQNDSDDPCARQTRTLLADDSQSNESINGILSHPSGQRLLSHAGGYLSGASDFEIKNFQVVINQGCSKGASLIDDCQSLSSHDTVPTQSCTNGHLSDRVVSNTRTPLSNIQFELQKKELDLNYRDDQLLRRERELQTKISDVARREILIKRAETELEVKQHVSGEPLPQPSELRFAMAAVKVPVGRLGESSQGHIENPGIAGEALAMIFGEEDAKGFLQAMDTFTLLQNPVGANYHLLQHPFLLLPHYNGLSKEVMKRLDEPLTVAIGGLVDDLYSKRQRSGRPLTFDGVRSQLSQCIFLQTNPDNLAGETFFRMVKCQKGVQIARFFLKPKWITDIVQSEKPEATFDAELSRSAGNSKAKAPLTFLSASRGHGGKGASEATKVMDLTVLSFPHPTKPWFKLSHLVMNCFEATKSTLSSKGKVYATVNYSSQTFHPRHDIIDHLNREAKARARARSGSIFLN